MDGLQPESGSRSSPGRGRFSSPPESPHDFLIGSLYQTAFGIQRLDKYLGALAAIFKSHRAFFVSWDPSQPTAGLLVGEHPATRLAEDYRRVPAGQNLWLRPKSRARVWLSSDASQSELQACAQFVRYLYDHDLETTLHIDAVRTKEWAAQFVLSRSRGSPGYDETDMELAWSVAAHAPRAFSLAGASARTELITTALTNVTEGAGLGIAIVNSSSLLFASDQARRMLNEIGAAVHAGIPTFDDSAPPERIRLPRPLAEAISKMGHKPGMTVLLPSNASESRFVVQARPLRTNELLPHWKAVGLFMHDPDKQPKPNNEVLRVVHGLTSAEARVSSLLAEGWPIESISERLGVSAHTVRAHLKKAFEKTGATRQAELVKMVLNSSRLPARENVIEFSPRPLRAAERPAADIVQRRGPAIERGHPPIPPPAPTYAEPNSSSVGGTLGTPRLR